MNKSNKSLYLAYSMLLLGALNSRATELFKLRYTSPSTVYSFSIDNPLASIRPAIIIAGLVSFAEGASKNIEACVMYSIKTSIISTLIHIALTNDRVDWNWILRTYGAHVLATITGDRLRALLNEYAAIHPRAVLASTCLAALLVLSAGK